MMATTTSSSISVKPDFEGEGCPVGQVVGFIVFDDKYTIRRKYKSFVKPVHCTKLTAYCKNLTGINQSDVDCGKKCNDAFSDIMKICVKYRAEIIIERLKLKKRKKNIGLFKIAELLKLKCDVAKHNAFNDVMILREVCKKLKLS